jgi:hypothetical protein
MFFCNTFPVGNAGMSVVGDAARSVMAVPFRRR